MPNVVLPPMQGSLTDYSDIELREMLSTRPWTLIASDHIVTLNAVISKDKRLGVQQPAKSEEISFGTNTFQRGEAADGATHVHA